MPTPPAGDMACALSVEALQGSRMSFLPQIHALRPLPGQQASAENLLRLLERSAIIEAHRWCDRVKDAYSLRCAPQVHGASRDAVAYCRRVVEIELASIVDNPVVGGYTPAKIALRRAISLAYDREKAIRILENGQAMPASLLAAECLRTTTISQPTFLTFSMASPSQTC